MLRGWERAGGEGGGCGGGGRRNSCSEVVTTLGTQPQHSQCLTLSGATAATTQGHQQQGQQPLVLQSLLRTQIQCQNRMIKISTASIILTIYISTLQGSRIR